MLNGHEPTPHQRRRDGKLDRPSYKCDNPIYGKHITWFPLSLLRVR